MARRARALRAAAMLGLAACGTVTTVPLVWKDPDYAGAGFQRILVIGVAEQPGTRRLFEDRFAAALAERGAAATASYALLPDPNRLGEERIRAAMTDGGYDAVIVTRLVDEEERTTVVPPRTYTVPGFYTGYYGYYRRSWDVVHEPGYTRVVKVVRLETNLYAAASGALVWSGQSETLDPSSVADVIASATAAVAGQLADDGLIR